MLMIINVEYDLLPETWSIVAALLSLLAEPALPYTPTNFKQGMVRHIEGFTGMMAGQEVLIMKKH